PASAPTATLASACQNRGSGMAEQHARPPMIPAPAATGHEMGEGYPTTAEFQEADEELQAMLREQGIDPDEAFTAMMRDLGVGIRMIFAGEGMEEG
ncbi:MAG: hypothetical protein Q9194_007693, partial [Teloschistes cf. exilis]